jgi:hypothetical protein
MGSRAAASAAPGVHFQPCAIHALDLSRAVGYEPHATAPTDWLSNQYASEAWVQRALVRHPWVARDARDADLTMLTASFSMWCVLKHGDTRTQLWAAAVRSPAVWSSRSVKALALQYGACEPPWAGSVAKQLGSAKRPPVDLVLLLDRINPWQEPRRVRSAVVVPFVVASPAWLVGSAAPPLSAPWADRQLLFFAGHVPKLYVNPTRYQLWRALRRERGVTAVSSTLSCTVGAFEACNRGERWLRAQPLAFFNERCAPHCNRSWMGDQRGKCGAPARAGRGFREANIGWLHRRCKAYHGVNFTDELTEMAAATRHLSHGQYLEHTLRHRFCLIAPGDYTSTHKITEAMAIGAAGGCVPVFIMPSAAPAKIGRYLSLNFPFSRWLDYCEARRPAPPAPSAAPAAPTTRAPVAARRRPTSCRSRWRPSRPAWPPPSAGWPPSAPPRPPPSTPRCARWAPASSSATTGGCPRPTSS